jgi:hypothetical protein
MRTLRHITSCTSAKTWSVAQAVVGEDHALRSVLSKAAAP